MNYFEIKKFKKRYHTWSKTVQSFAFSLTPTEIKKAYVTDEEYNTFLKLPFCRSNDGVILINEDIQNWEFIKDLLLALDKLPDSLLIDIYTMDSVKYQNTDWDNILEFNIDKALRKTIYKLLPEIIWAHGKQCNEN